MAFSGDDRSHTTDAQHGGHGVPWVNEPPIGCTCAEPPPEITATSACDPITAIDCSADACSGNWFAEFFSSTAPCSSISCATAASAAAGTACSTGVLSKIPTWNMARSIRYTILSRRDCGTVPLWTACSRAEKYCWFGCSWSRPAAAAAAVLWVAHQSDITKPGKLQSPLSTVLNRDGFSQS